MKTKSQIENRVELLSERTSLALESEISILMESIGQNEFTLRNNAVDSLEANNYGATRIYLWLLES